MSTTDFNVYRPKIGTVLPALPSADQSLAMTAALVDIVLGAIDQEDFPDQSTTTVASGTIAGGNQTQQQRKSPTKTDA